MQLTSRLCLVALLLVALVTISVPPRVDAQATGELVVLTTTTTQDTGILKHLVDAFEKSSGLRVKTIVAGSGDVMKQGARGEGDVLLTHSPAAEKEWMKQGYGTSRRLVMYNDFIIIGPPSDPAGAKGTLRRPTR